MVRYIRYILSFVFVFYLNAFAQNISVKASTDKSEYLVGDYIYYTIKVDYAKGLKVYPPDIKDSLSSLTVVKKENPVEEEKDGKVSDTFKFILSGYDSARVTIPSVPVMFKAPGDTSMSFANSDSISIMVRTVKVDQKADIKDVKAPIKIPLNWWWIALWAFIALIIAGIIYFLYRRHRKNKAGAQPIKKIIILPPYQVALNALHELEDQKLWQKGEIKAYHSAITEIIRKYFEERFKMPAMELPTSEAVELLKSLKGTEAVLDTAYSFFTNADLVKFAKFVPLGSVNEEMMKQAYEIVNKTKDGMVEIIKEEAGNVQ